MKPNFYKENLKVTSAMCDTLFSVSISGVLDAFQNAQTAHTMLMGVDAPTMRAKDDAFWVLSKYQLHFFSKPAWNQEIAVTTWPSPPSLVKAERQLFVEDNDGNTLISAKAEWCALGFNDRKIRKLSSLTCYPFDMEHKTEKAWDGGFIPLSKKPDESDYVYSVKVRHSHLDFNRHVNNVKYVSMLTDCYGADFWENVTVSDFEIAYLNESVEGDEIRIFSRKEDNYLYFWGNLADGKEIFRAVIIIND